jgi:RIO-like serine/threonine protein kinase
MAWAQIRVLKADLFGRVEQGHLSERGAQILAVRRDIAAARWWVRWLARSLARREQRALRVLDGVGAVPSALGQDRRTSLRSWLEGEPMQIAQPRSIEYFDQARKLLVQMHRRGVTHNDLAKEPNWLVTPSGAPALIDFQLASVHQKRSKLFRVKGREDLRHLLKHKRTYCPEALTNRELSILAKKSLPSRIWMRTGKPVYLFVTRRLLGWSDREGAGDRI